MTSETVKTTIRFNAALWLKARHRALDEGLAVQDLVQKALEAYLKTPLKKKKRKEVRE